ncbi:acyltransferase family protein [Streptomyces sp.]|uniref:acyltransferase family protein n=1 Tax=Streptomyces sp. TaxID=1931 RepID=UPI002F400D83
MTPDNADREAVTAAAPAPAPATPAPSPGPAPASAPAPRAARLNSLSGLRFPFAVGVFLFHAALGAPTLRLFADDGVENAFYRTIAPAGPPAVTFFFILSGFIMTWSAPAADTARSFWRRRFVKVVPNYVVAWALWMTVIGASGTPTWRVVVDFFMLQSWVPDVNTFFSLNVPGWSLSAEFFFYLAFPLLFHAARRIPARHLKFWLAGLVGLICFVPLIAYSVMSFGTARVPNEPAQSANYLWVVYIFPVSRVVDFALGIVVARAVMLGRWRNIGLIWSGVLFVAAYAAAFHIPYFYGVRVVFTVPAALLVAAAAIADNEGRFTLFRNRAMTWLGEISFAFYLLHYIVLVETRSLLGTRMFGVPATIGIMLLELAVSVLAAWALYALVERPLTRKWSRPRKAASAQTARVPRQRVASDG